MPSRHWKAASGKRSRKAKNECPVEISGRF
jgi:hypothetical protein